MMPNFTFPLHKYDSKKRLNRQQVLSRLAPTLVKVNDLTPLPAFSQSKEISSDLCCFYGGGISHNEDIMHSFQKFIVV